MQTIATVLDHLRESGRAPALVFLLALLLTPAMGAAPASAHARPPVPAITVPAPPGGVNPCEAVAKGPNLKPGSKGPAVAQLQRCVDWLGARPGGADGVYGRGFSPGSRGGSNTFHAVLTLQKHGGLTRHGKVGPQFREYVATARPLGALPCGNQHHGCVSTTKGVVYFNDGGRIRLMDTSTGSGETYVNSYGQTRKAITPNMVCVINGARQFEEYFSKSIEGAEMPFSSFCGQSGIAFHDAAAVGATDLSKGCFRLTPYNNQRYLFPRLKDGMVFMVSNRF